MLNIESRKKTKNWTQTVPAVEAAWFLFWVDEWSVVMSEGQAYPCRVAEGDNELCMQYAAIENINLAKNIRLHNLWKYSLYSFITGAFNYILY